MSCDARRTQITITSPEHFAILIRLFIRGSGTCVSRKAVIILC